MPIPRLLALLACAAVPALAAEPDEDHADALQRVRDLEEDLREVIEEVAPAVGAVTNHATLFDPKTGTVAVRPRGVGSGTVITRDGLFLTNVHVVEGAGYITVALPDGGRYPARLYSDTSEGRVKGDIALLQLHGKSRWEYVDWRRGDSEGIEPGSFVLAMGNPRGHALDGTPVVTLGILSGKGQAAAGTGYLYLDALQTDAAINPGNSGGPLFDSRGHLIGINGLINTRNREQVANSGVGFAIPMHQVRRFMGRLLESEGEAVGYGFHGLRVQSAAEGRGAVVVGVVSGSPADEAGLRRGDVVYRANGRRLANQTDFQNVVDKMPEKASVRLNYLRGRKKRTAVVRLASWSEWREEMTGAQGPRPLPLHERGYLGVRWKETPGDDGRPRVVVTEVTPGTGAVDELEVGDVILRVDGEEIASAAGLVERLAPRAWGERVEVDVDRGGLKRTGHVDLCDPATAAGMETGE